MRKPDFFIVGAPKCGTTAMQDYLSQHPEIYMPKRKELHFFGRDLRFSYERLVEKEYLSYFKNATNEKRVGEASVWYLYSKLAAREIKEFNPCAKIIIMLRNPVDVLYSLHSQFLYGGNEDIIDFRVALAAEEDRKRGFRIPKTAYLIEGLYYSKVVRFSEQVNRYFDVFGRDSVFLIIFDDFESITVKVFKDTLRFLDVEAEFQPNFQIVNPNKKIRSEFIGKNLILNPPRIFRTFKIIVPRLIRESLLESVKRYNTKYERRPSLDPDLRKSLQMEFASEIESLSNLLGKDLTHWSRPA